MVEHDRDKPRRRGRRPGRERSAGDSKDQMAWDGSAELGNLLRQRRGAAGQTLELAATILGTNPTYLARLERGEAVSPPSPSFLLRVAEAYHLRVDELAEAAGLSITVPSDLLWADDPAVHIRFRRLAERFRPIALQPTAYEYYSAVHKAWAVSLAFSAEQFALVNSPGRSLRDTLADRAEGTRTSEEIAQLRSDSISLMTWEGDPGFGEYLARLRQRSGLTIREIGSRMGVSHTMVANLAKQRWRRAPTRDLVERISVAYGVDLYDLMEQAGYRSGIPTTTMLGIGPHELFRMMVVDLGVRPDGMTDHELALWSGLQKQQMGDLAERVDLLVRELGRPCVGEIVASESTPEAT